MKRFLYIFLAAVVLLPAVSCLDDQDEIDRRDRNLDYLESLKDSADIYPLEYNDSLLTVAAGGTYNSDSVAPASGIYYKVLRSSDSIIPIMGETVTVYYTASLIDGTEFDEGSIDATLGGSIIVGWSLVLERMPIGAKWKVYIPYDLGYGTVTYNDVPSYSTLIFEMDLRGYADEDD